jgi:hypothetical protein
MTELKRSFSRSYTLGCVKNKQTKTKYAMIAIPAILLLVTLALTVYSQAAAVSSSCNSGYMNKQAR